MKKSSSPLWLTIEPRLVNKVESCSALFLVSVLRSTLDNTSLKYLIKIDNQISPHNLYVPNLRIKNHYHKYAVSHPYFEVQKCCTISSPNLRYSSKASGVTNSETGMCFFVGRMYWPNVITSTPASRTLLIAFTTYNDIFPVFICWDLHNLEYRERLKMQTSEDHCNINSSFCNGVTERKKMGHKPSASDIQQILRSTLHWEWGPVTIEV